MKVEAADIRLICLLPNEALIPGPVGFGRGNSQILEIGLDLNADVNALVTDVAGVSFEQACNLSFTKIAE